MGRKRGDKDLRAYFVRDEVCIEIDRGVFPYIIGWKGNGRKRTLRAVTAGPLKFLIVTAASIFIAEALVMLFLPSLRLISLYSIALVDSLILTALVFPVLYLELFRPMLKNLERIAEAEREVTDSYERLKEKMRELEIADKELREYRGHLERLVEERTSEQRKSNEDLKSALQEVKRLSGLLPICSWCKKIRDDKGYWSQVEAYISGHSEAEFTHSICPECMKKHYGEFIKEAGKG